MRTGTPCRLRLLVLCCWLVLSLSSAPIIVKDDDYCDDTAHGTDERNSSACTFVPSLKAAFVCAGETSASIPLSRVGDGVCDCCDGSDELAGKCQDTCAQEKLDAKVQALQWHRNTQAGGHKRAELVNALMRRKAREALTMDTLVSDRSQVERLDMTMRYWKRHEDAKEAVSHWRLLRERELRCIRGDERFCDFFYSGFLAEDELFVPNAPDGFLARSRNRNQTSIEDGGTMQLGDGNLGELLKSQSPLERVRGTLCKADNIIPDDSLRMFVTLGDYLAFQTSPGGVKSRKKTPSQKRKETLFVRFLEASGEHGPMHGALLLGELASLLLLPATLPVYALAWTSSAMQESFWSRVTACAGNPKDGATSWSLSRSICHIIVQATVPGSTANEVVNFFDYTQYSAISNFADHYVHPYRHGPNVVMKLLWYAPIIYWQYYVVGAGRQLPPSRHTCLLRAGDVSIRAELEKLHRRQAEEKELALMLERKERSLDAALSGSGSGLTDGSWADFGELGEYEVLKRQCLESPALGSPPYSYTLCYFQDIVQTALGVTDTGELDGSRGESVTLGRFAHWGPRPSSDGSWAAAASVGSVENRGDPTLQFRDKNKQAAEAVRVERTVKERKEESKNHVLHSWAHTISTVLGNLASGTAASKRAAALDAVRNTTGYFSHQTYTNGDECHVSGGSKPRVAQVAFDCAPTAAIEAVAEAEMCVYNVRVTGPMHCTAAVEAASLDKLDKLGVFGFTKKTSKASAASLGDTVHEKRKKAERLAKQAELTQKNADDKLINEQKTEAARIAKLAARKLQEDRARDAALGRPEKGIKMMGDGNPNLKAPAMRTTGKGSGGSSKLHMDVIEAAVDGAGEVQQLSEDAEFLSLMDDGEETEEGDLPTLLDSVPVPGKAVEEMTLRDKRANLEVSGLAEDEIIVGGLVRPKRPKTRSNPTPEELGFHNLPPERKMPHEM